MTIPGVLLTGGASRRMGADKASLPVGSETFAERSARVLANVCAPVVEVGCGATTLPVVRDGSEGPLVAFLAGVDHLQPRGAVFLLACDLPMIDEPTLRWIMEQPGVNTIIPTVGDIPQYACARYSSDAIANARASGSHALAALADADDAIYLAADDRAAVLADVDTPADLERLDL